MGKNETQQRIQEILERVRRNRVKLQSQIANPISPSPAKHKAQDINAAKSILSNLVSAKHKNDVTSQKEVVQENYEE